MELDLNYEGQKQYITGQSINVIFNLFSFSIHILMYKGTVIGSQVLSGQVLLYFEITNV